MRRRVIGLGALAIGGLSVETRVARYFPADLCISVGSTGSTSGDDSRTPFSAGVVFVIFAMGLALAGWTIECSGTVKRRVKDGGMCPVSSGVVRTLLVAGDRL